MKHPTEEQLKPLLLAVDTAVWAWSVKQSTRKGYSCKVNWKNAFDELIQAYESFQLKTSDLEVILSSPAKPLTEGR